VKAVVVSGTLDGDEQVMSTNQYAAYYRINPATGGAGAAVRLPRQYPLVTGYGVGFSGLPFVGAVVDVADVPLAATLGLCMAGLLPGAAVTWALVRDIPIRNRVA
jgi:hypothetical protein